jgi:ATP-dependent Clp protease adaptor protein ClpS
MADPHEYTDLDSAAEVDVLHDQATKRPVRYRVILHNDDYTTMEFVVSVLILFFSKSEDDATRIMLEVHHQGRGVAGTYVRDVAESKADNVEKHARMQGFPLKCTAEPAEESADPAG